MTTHPEWEEVFRTINPLEAEFIRGLLSTNGITVVVEATGLKAMPVLFGHSANGALVVLVPPDAADTARALLAATPEMEADGQA